jgi:hypothetical protein
MAAAAAAAAALLAVPVTAHASAEPGPRAQAGGFGATPNWGGYVLHAKPGQRFQQVQASG